MRGAYHKERRATTGTGTKAQRGLDMLDRNVGLARPLPEDAAQVPAASVVRVERQGTGIVAGHFQGSPRKIGALQSGRRRIILAAIVNKQPITAECGPGEGRPVTRIACDRLLHQTERLRELPCRG